jgi:hypothetical protein
MGGEVSFKLFYKPFHYTNRLVIYKLDNKSPIFFHDHKHVHYWDMFYAS